MGRAARGSGDNDITRFLASLPRDLPYSELAERCAKRFGARAWSAGKIKAWWIALPPGSPIERDPDLRAFIDDRLGRWTLTRLAEACRSEFGSHAPKRSAIHRYFKRWRARSEKGAEPSKGRPRPARRA